MKYTSAAMPTIDSLPRVVTVSSVSVQLSMNSHFFWSSRFCSDASYLSHWALPFAMPKTKIAGTSLGWVFVMSSATSRPPVLTDGTRTLR